MNVKYLGSRGIKFRVYTRKTITVPSALPETVASIAVAAAVVGAAATLLAKRTQESETSQTPVKVCEDCAGSGICSECRGEGFVLQRLTKESAERARMASQDAATRYTSGLPRKWSYCSKCSAARSCTTCDGTGRLNS